MFEATSILFMVIVFFVLFVFRLFFLFASIFCLFYSLLCLLLLFFLSFVLFHFALSLLQQYMYCACIFRMYFIYLFIYLQKYRLQFLNNPNYLKWKSRYCLSINCWRIVWYNRWIQSTPSMHQCTMSISVLVSIDLLFKKGCFTFELISTMTWCFLLLINRLQWCKKVYIFWIHFWYIEA